jgi:glycosyltransferase involved in cell wall biosynthesis
MSNKPVCVFQSPIWTRSGYGDWAIAVAKSLYRYGKFDLHIVPTQWGACSKKALDEEAKDPDGKALLDRILRQPLQKQPELFIQMTIPNEYQAPGKFNIGITAGIETTVPRAEWLEGLNRMNVNFVLSQHVKDVFAGANYTKRLPDGRTEPLVVKTPMEVTNWSADTRVYKKTDEKVATVDEALAGIKEDFSFLFVGQWTAGNLRSDRKAIGYLIKTFLETFAGVENPPALVVKTSGAQICVMDRYDCITKINDITNMVKQQIPNTKLPSVYLLHGELSDVEMNALYNHDKIKVHVSFTHGEGFGHPMLLSTLSGKPLLAPGWSGQLDFLNKDYANFLEGSLNPIPDEALNDWFVKEARWFDVDYAKAGQKMKQVFLNYDAKLLEKAEKLRAENAEKFSAEAMDKQLHALLDKYLPKFEVAPALVLPKLKKLNLPGATAPNGQNVPIKQGEPAKEKETSPTTLVPATQ